MAPTDNSSSSNTESTERLRALVARLSAADLERSLGGGWTVGFALIHLAFWDARQDLALHRFTRGDGFPSEDWVTNATLEAIAPLFSPSIAGDIAVKAAEQLDDAIGSLTTEQQDALHEAGFAYAIERWPHRDEHLAQIEAVLS